MTIRKYNSIILFITGFFLFMFTRRSELFPTIQIMIIIAPIFILRFIRIQSTKKGILLTFLGFFLSLNIALFGLFDLSGSLMEILFNTVRSTIIALMYFVPYMVDRLIYPKFKKYPIISSLIFPVSVTAIMFLFSLEGPIDGTEAKTIFSYGPLIFQQINSITGLWGFIFIFSWIATTINNLWEYNFEIKKSKTVLVVFASIFLVSLFFGTIKVNTTNQYENTVKIAAIILLPEDGKAVSMEKIIEERNTSSFNKRLLKIEQLTKTASQKGAKIISFQEFAMLINDEDQDSLRKEYKRIAKENNVYLSITYGYFSKKEKGENKHLLINNQGEILLDYTKRYLLGFGDIGETAVFKKGVEIIQYTDTPYGRLAISICKDMNYPAYIRQAGEADVDIMLNPSYDFPKSTSPSYYDRAIENGFSIIRPTYNGITYMEDYNGEIIAMMDSDKTETGILYADLPIKGVETIYYKIGDLLGWLSLFGLFVLIFISIRLKNNS
ncbi:hypothetical protein GM661_09430 [Iocasia frigidifontis]|uniref:CN hydrolase domain-containing protein n=1 Tax=Iocasia fonsfrigidae TaxID=2682810 RepID=A0A8A7KJ75_9FIRM|nr:carbon-nitrogen hydrolase family protein [Iocasia fonsfrigidae]QTL98184.1 hypothetical protein GM661_09430 [Iocasia fonsfrigidae]